MRLKLSFVVGLFVVCGESSLNAQFAPAIAKMRETRETIVAGKVIKTETREGLYYRSSDGSYLERWTKLDGDERAAELAPGGLWDNKHAVGYRLDFKNRRAYLKHANTSGPVGPDTLLSETSRPYPKDTVEGIQCLNFPTSVEASGRPRVRVGQSCWSIQYNLELKHDLTFPFGNDKVEHNVFTLYDIHLNVEPDPNVFNVDANFTVYRP